MASGSSLDREALAYAIRIPDSPGNQWKMFSAFRGTRTFTEMAAGDSWDRQALLSFLKIPNDAQLKVEAFDALRGGRTFEEMAQGNGLDISAMIAILKTNSNASLKTKIIKNLWEQRHNPHTGKYTNTIISTANVILADTTHSNTIRTLGRVVNDYETENGLALSVYQKKGKGNRHPDGRGKQGSNYRGS